MPAASWSSANHRDSRMTPLWQVRHHRNPLLTVHSRVFNTMRQLSTSTTRRTNSPPSSSSRCPYRCYRYRQKKLGHAAFTTLFSHARPRALPPCPSSSSSSSSSSPSPTTISSSAPSPTERGCTRRSWKRLACLGPHVTLGTTGWLARFARVRDDESRW